MNLAPSTAPAALEKNLAIFRSLTPAQQRAVLAECRRALANAAKRGAR